MNHCGQPMTARRIHGTLRTKVYHCEKCGYSTAPSLKVPMWEPRKAELKREGLFFRTVETRQGRVNFRNKVFLPKVALAILLGAFVLMNLSLGFQWAHSLYFFVPLIAMKKKGGSADRRDFLRRAALVGGGGVMGAALMGVGQRALAGGPSSSQVAVYNKFTTVEPYDFMVFTDGTNQYAKSGNTGAELVTNTTPDFAALMNSVDALATTNSINRIFIGRGTFAGGAGGAAFQPSNHKGYIFSGLAGPDQTTPATLINWTSTSVSLFNDTNWGSFIHENTFCMENLYITCTSFTGTLLNDSSSNINAWYIDNCTIQNISTPGNYVHTGTCFNPSFSTESNATSWMAYTDIFGFNKILVSGGGLFGIDHCQFGFFNGHGVEINGTGSPFITIYDLKLFNIIAGGVGIYDNRTFTSVTSSILWMEAISQENSSLTNYTNVNGAPYVLILSSAYIGIPTLPLIITNVGKGATYNKSESGADANVLTYTPPSDGSGAGQSTVMYRVRFALSISAASSAVVGWTVTYTDINGNAQTPTNLPLFQLGTAAPALTFTTSATGDYYGEVIIAPDGLANIVVKFTLGSGTITAKATAEVEAV